MNTSLTMTCSTCHTEAECVCAWLDECAERARVNAKTYEQFAEALMPYVKLAAQGFVWENYPQSLDIMVEEYPEHWRRFLDYLEWREFNPESY